MKTLYDQLGITAQASPKAIQQAFFRLAKKFDPGNPANQGNPDAGTSYRAVHEAYRILSDPELRHKYDHSVQGKTLLQRAEDARLLRTGSKTKPTEPAGLP